MTTLNFDKSVWGEKCCPKVDCRKSNCKCGLKFVDIPAALGDDSKDSKVAPKNGAYCNAIVKYEANNSIYLYSSEGIPTKMNIDILELEKLVDREARIREAADKVLQDEIDAIKNSPDVVDIVATYADLIAYDTSSLGNNDIIRVLVDETKEGKSTYYRWSTTSETWSYIGAVGDYYSVAFKPFPASVETNGTTQQFMNSIQSLNPPVGMAYIGTVSLSDMPAGLVQEEVEVYVYSNYVLYCTMRSSDVSPYEWWCCSYNYQGWRPVNPPSVVVFYADASESGQTRHIYKDADMQDAASAQDILDASRELSVLLRSTTTLNPNEFNDAILNNIWSYNGDYQFVFSDTYEAYNYSVNQLSSSTFDYSSGEFQYKLTAGSNISITGNTISSTTPVATNSTVGGMKIADAFGTQLSSGNELKARVYGSSDYSTMQNDAFVSKGTLEYTLGNKQSMFSNAGYHNSIFRGADLTNKYTIDELSAKVQAGDFSDIFIGDYITKTVQVGSNTARELDFVVAGIDYFYGMGDTELTQHHLVIVPATAFYETMKMNDNNTTTTGYYGSQAHGIASVAYTAGSGGTLTGAVADYDTFLGTSLGENDGTYAFVYNGTTSVWEYNSTEIGVDLTSYGITYTGTPVEGDTLTLTFAKGYLEPYRQAIYTAFGDAHILNHRENMSTSTSTSAWHNARVELMNESIVYGQRIRANNTMGGDAFAKSQLPLFRIGPNRVVTLRGKGGIRSGAWLSSIASGTSFCLAGGSGLASSNTAATAYGVRPYFLFN